MVGALGERTWLAAVCDTLSEKAVEAVLEASGLAGEIEVIIARPT